MKKIPVLTERDMIFFEDISRFGFTTTEHYKLRFNTSFIQARKRFHKLTNGNYLKKFAISSATKRRIYLPDYWFFKIFPYKNVCKINPHQISHDEYILRLYSILKRNNLGKEIVIEQDLKKSERFKKYSRIPDLLLNCDFGSYVFEYEKSIKNNSKYEKMLSFYENMTPSEFYFVFICETDEIAIKLKEKCRKLTYVSFMKPCGFLQALEEKSFTTLPEILNSENSYFPPQKKILSNMNKKIKGTIKEQTGNNGMMLKK
jgi:hypothetical protein